MVPQKIFVIPRKRKYTVKSWVYDVQDVRTRTIKNVGMNCNRHSIRLIERLPTQNGPIGNKIGLAHVHKNLSYTHSPRIGHRVCAWFQEMYDEINDIFFGDTPYTHFWTSFQRLERRERGQRLTYTWLSHTQNALLDTHTHIFSKQTHRLTNQVKAMCWYICRTPVRDLAPATGLWIHHILLLLIFLLIKFNSDF